MGIEDVQYTRYQPSQLQQVLAVFEGSFADAEGEAEGRSIASLVEILIGNGNGNGDGDGDGDGDGTDIGSGSDSDVQGYCAVDQQEVIAAVFFSRLMLPDEGVTAFMLSPMAVRTSRQKLGVGQSLIRYGLDRLEGQAVDLVVTYGDPAFYGRLGFQPVTVEQIAAPYTLSQPEGWQAVLLAASEMPSNPGATRCVPALCNPAYW